MSFIFATSDQDSALVASDRRVMQQLPGGGYRQVGDGPPKIRRCGAAWLAGVGGLNLVGAMLEADYSSLGEIEQRLRVLAAFGGVLSPTSVVALFEDKQPRVVRAELSGRVWVVTETAGTVLCWPPDVPEDRQDEVMGWISQSSVLTKETLHRILATANRSSEHIGPRFDVLLLPAQGSPWMGMMDVS